MSKWESSAIPNETLVQTMQGLSGHDKETIFPFLVLWLKIDIRE